MEGHLQSVVCASLGPGVAAAAVLGPHLHIQPQQEFIQGHEPTVVRVNEAQQGLRFLAQRRRSQPK